MCLAQREHSRQELHDKLWRWVKAQHAVQAMQAASADAADPSPGRLALPVPEEISPLLDELEAAGHLSDARVVESRIHLRSARFGNLRIDRELQRLGVAASQSARQALQANELERARSVWARKFGQAPQCAADKARQMRFLAGRGFSADTVRAVLHSPVPDEPDV